MKKPLISVGSALAPAILFVVLGSWQEVGLANIYPPGTVRYAGRATVLRANVKVLTANVKAVLADTGELDADGATKDATVLTFDNPPPLELHSKTANAIAAGAGNFSAATAAVEKLNINVGLLKITADVIEADSSAECSQASGTVGVAGLSTIVNLKINGLPIKVSKVVNDTIKIPGVATVILNEQTQPDVNSIVVNAVHVIVPGLLGAVNADIVIAHAESGILTCNSL